MGLRLSDEAVSVLIEALEAQTKAAEQALNDSFDEKLDCINFIATSYDMMRAFGEFIGDKYAGKPDKIRGALDYFHDSFMDMSTVSGCETIFTSWND